ncbi:GntR family transcriptional regulator [Actinoplanes sp. NPDC051859]|uniref:GntR family transcriptional regulator n=1 Tax=Actinoplanes sp. NPDC051859 TaxID=3363909 RepID=UPI0037A89EF5
MSSQPRLTRPEPLHQQIARKLRNDIAAGVLADGAVLPATRDLAVQYGVSVFTVSEAMKLLAADGLIRSEARSRRTVTASDQMRRSEIKARMPQVLLIGGYAGSGKTELGRIIAKETGWPILDKDTLTRPVVEAALQILGQSPNDRESPTYLEQVRPREYEALHAAAVENVECGNSAIVTAPFLREFAHQAWLSRTLARFADLGAMTTLVWVYCDLASMHTYLRQRGAARDAAKLADWKSYTAAVDLELRPSGRHYVIDNCTSSEPLTDQAKHLLKVVLDGDSE